MRKITPAYSVGWIPNLLFSALGIYLLVKTAVIRFQTHRLADGSAWFISGNGRGFLKMFERHRVPSSIYIREYLKIFALSLGSLMLIYIVVLFSEDEIPSLSIRLPSTWCSNTSFIRFTKRSFNGPFLMQLSWVPCWPLGMLSRHSEITALRQEELSLSYYRSSYLHRPDH